MDETPEDCLSFMQMTIMDDGSKYGDRTDFDPYNDIVVLPFSSGTTGPPKGVSLTHYNMVANLSQLSHPEVLIEGLRNLENQETTVAVLPFFHIMP
jgi:4-coumarate--CoA ligase